MYHPVAGAKGKEQKPLDHLGDTSPGSEAANSALPLPQKKSHAFAMAHACHSTEVYFLRWRIRMVNARPARIRAAVSGATQRLLAMLPKLLSRIVFSSRPVVSMGENFKRSADQPHFGHTIYSASVETIRCVFEPGAGCTSTRSRIASFTCSKDRPFRQVVAKGCSHPISTLLMRNPRAGRTVSAVAVCSYGARDRTTQKV
jgi:hypothetical protein